MTRYLCDANVWVALAVDNHEHGPVCRKWFETLSGSERALFCRNTQQSFLRLLTVAAVFTRYGSPPLGNQQAWRTHESMRADQRVDYVGEEPAG